MKLVAVRAIPSHNKNLVQIRLVYVATKGRLMKKLELEVVDALQYEHVTLLNPPSLFLTHSFTLFTNLNLSPPSSSFSLHLVFT